MASSIISLFATLGALAYSIAMTMAGEDISAMSKSLTVIICSPLLHVCYTFVVTNWVPVAYLLRPPIYPNRIPCFLREHDIPVKSSV